MSVTQILSKHVDYQKTDPTEYNEKTKNGHNTYKKTLNDILDGPHGKSTLPLMFKSGRQDFDVAKVKLGLTPSCPMPMQQQIIAQHDWRANENRKIKEEDPATNDSIRITNLMSSILGTPLSILCRITRAVARSVFMPFTVLYALHQQYRYGIKDWAKEDIRRIGWEWVDTGVSLISFFTGIINTFHPNAIKLDIFRDYYIQRINEAIGRNQEFARAKLQYERTRDDVEAADAAAKSEVNNINFGDEHADSVIVEDGGTL